MIVFFFFVHLQMNNMLWQFQMQQVEQLSEGFSKRLQRHSPAGGNSSRGDQRQQDNSQYRYHQSQMNRGQHYGDEQGSGRHQQQHGHGRENYHQNDRSGNRHYDNRGGNRHYDDRGNNRGNRDYDSKWRRYWVMLRTSVKYLVPCIFMNYFLKKKNLRNVLNHCVYSGHLYMILSIRGFSNDFF